MLTQGKVLTDVPGADVMGGAAAKGGEVKDPGGRLVRLVDDGPPRGLFGDRSEFPAATRGEGIPHHRFLESAATPATNLSPRARIHSSARRGATRSRIRPTRNGRAGGAGAGRRSGAKRAGGVRRTSLGRGGSGRRERSRCASARKRD
jgi:hypothetical protein